MNRNRVAEMEQPAIDEKAPAPVELGIHPEPYTSEELHAMETADKEGSFPPMPAHASAPLPLPPPAEEPKQEVLNAGKPVLPREQTWADRIEALEVREEAREKHLTAVHTMLDQAVEEINHLRTQLNLGRWHPDLTKEREG